MNENKTLAFADAIEMCVGGNSADPQGAVPVVRTPPTQVLLLKYGKNQYTQDGKTGDFDLSEDDAESIVQEFDARGRDLLFDYEHANLIPGQEAPAAGWIQKLVKTRDGILAIMKSWTDKAKEYLTKGEYRYSSPVVQFNDKGKPFAIQSVALTNHPAMHGPTALVAASDVSVLALSDDARQSATIESYKKRLASIKFDLDDLTDAGSDEARAESLKGGLNREIGAFMDYTHASGTKAFTDAQSYVDALFSVDLPDGGKDATNTIENKEPKKKEQKNMKELKKILGLADKEIEAVPAEGAVTDIAISEELPAAAPAPEAGAAEGEDKAVYEQVLDAVTKLQNGLKTIADALGCEANPDAIMMKLNELLNRPTGEDMAMAQDQLAASDAKVSVEKVFSEKRIAESMRPWAADFAKRDPAGFKAFADKLPAGLKIVPDNKALADVSAAPAAGSKGAEIRSFTDAELKMAKIFGKKPEDIYKK